jgi:hypothetical protein
LKYRPQRAASSEVSRQGRIADRSSPLVPMLTMSGAIFLLLFISFRCVQMYDGYHLFNSKRSYVLRIQHFSHPPIMLTTTTQIRIGILLVKVLKGIFMYQILL